MKETSKKPKGKTDLPALRADSASLVKFADALGLGTDIVADTQYRLKAVEKIGGMFRVILEESGGGEFAFSLLSPGDERFYIKIAHLNIIYEGEQIGDAERTLLEAVAAKLGRSRMKDLRALFTADTGVAAVDRNQQKMPDMSEIRLTRWGNPDAWRDFFHFYNSEKDYLTGDWIAFTNKSCALYHTETECIYVNPPPELRYADHSGTIRGSHSSQSVRNFFYTGITDKEIIMGGGSKLDAALESITAGGALGAAITENCSAMIIGDDFHSKITRLKKKTGLPILGFDQMTENPLAKLADFVHELAAKSDFFTKNGKPDTFNTVGYPDCRAMDELCDFLAECGIRRGVSFLPAVDLDNFRHFTEAGAQVFLPAEKLKAVRDELGKLPPTMISPAAPFGMESTKRWLSAVASAIGKKDAFDALWRSEIKRLRPTWNTLVSEASKFRLGFVTDSDSIALLAEPEKFTIVDLPSVISEMGFGIDIYIYTVTEETDAAISLATKALKRAKDVRIEVFASRGELDSLLRCETPHAVFSSDFFDSRLTRHGKSRFSLSDFEMGHEGALRTAERLISACRLPFFRRYADYLKTS